MSKRKLEVPEISRSLTQWRKSKGWTRKQAADHLGIKVRTLESWEYGKRKPPGLYALEKLWATKRRAS